MSVEIKWFVNRSNNGEIVLLFQTSWLDGIVHEEIVWNKKNLRWQESRIIHEHFLNPDSNIDEVSHKYAYELFPEAVKQLPLFLHDEVVLGITLRNRRK